MDTLSVKTVSNGTLKRFQLSKNTLSKNSSRNKTGFRLSRLLPKIHSRVCPYYKTSYELPKGTKTTFGSNYTNCFVKRKIFPANDLVLQYLDFSKEFILTTDTSNVAITGNWLSQSPTRS